MIYKNTINNVPTSKRKKILLTGFEPFGGEISNPAYEAIKLVPDIILDHEIIKIKIPTVFNEGADKILEHLDLFNNNFEAILSIGQAGNRSCITLEKVAINLAEARIPDNKGNQPINTIIKKDGETAYFTTLPIKGMLQNIKKNNLPAHISYTAGTYVCNDVMYQMLYYMDKNLKNIRTGFIHVPYTSSQVVDKPNGTPFMPLETIAKSIEYAIEGIIKNETDLLDVLSGEIS